MFKPLNKKNLVLLIVGLFSFSSVIAGAETVGSASSEIATEAADLPVASMDTAVGRSAAMAEILERVDRALNPESYVSYKKIINIDTKGVKKEFVMYVGKLGADKVLGSFLAPKSEVGRATLRIGENMWLYIPNVKKPVRITSLQSVTGGLFNNSDIMGLDYSDEYECIGLKKDEGRIVLELKARNGSVAYEKLIIKADPQTYLADTIDCFTSSGMLVKSLHFKNIVEFEKGFSRPSVIETDSPLYKGAKSIMIYSQLKRVQLDEELFNINSMARYQELR
jgi:hypothetical protein